MRETSCSVLHEKSLTQLVIVAIAAGKQKQVTVLDLLAMMMVLVMTELGRLALHRKTEIANSTEEDKEVPMNRAVMMRELHDLFVKTESVIAAQVMMTMVVVVR